MKKFKEVIRKTAERDKAYEKKEVHLILTYFGFMRRPEEEYRGSMYSVYFRPFDGRRNTRDAEATLKEFYPRVHYYHREHSIRSPYDAVEYYSVPGLIVSVRDSYAQLYVVDESVISEREKTRYERELDRRYLYSREPFDYWRSPPGGERIRFESAHDQVYTIRR